MTRFDIESAVLGPDGPSSATTRFVVLAIATFVKRKGSLHCWPSVTALQKATLLSRATIVTHLKIALDTGWLKKEFGRAGNMRRPGNIYELSLPKFASKDAVKSRPTMPTAALVESGSTMPTAEPVEQAGLCQQTGATMPTDAPPLCQLTRSPSTSEVKEEIKGFEVKDANVKNNVKGGDKDRSEKPEKESGSNRASQREESAIEDWAKKTGMIRGDRETAMDFRKRATAAWILDKQREHTRHA